MKNLGINCFNKNITIFSAMAQYFKFGFFYVCLNLTTPEQLISFRGIFKNLYFSGGGLGVAIWMETQRKFHRCLLSSWNVCGIWLNSFHKTLNSMKRFFFRFMNIFIHANLETSLEIVRRKEKNSSKMVWLNGLLFSFLAEDFHQL